MTLLSIQNLSLSIGITPVLHDVSFDIAAGEIVALTGESGSGKSMTALAVMQLQPEAATTTGQIKLSGADLNDLPESTLCTMRGNEFGMVFQEPATALNPLQTIGQQVAEAIQIHDIMPKATAMEQAAAMLTRVGMPQDLFPLTRYPHELSGGQRQRVVIAMAIARRPCLLIADEPTTALDVTTQARVLDLLKDLVQEFDMGLLIITHDLAVVADIADRIVVMRRGNVVEQGPTKTLLANMQHPYTRALFEASSHAVDLPPAQNDPTPILTVRNVTRDYPQPRLRMFAPRAQLRAVNNVSLEIHQGEHVGLVGESGCGKSTLTRAILGLEPVQKGTITAFGHPVGPTMPAAQRLKTQVVFQDPYSSFNPRHKVSRILAEPFYLIKAHQTGAQLERAISDVLSDVGLTSDDADKYIHEFSGGQRQRIAIARALITRPELIIFDEAVSALDVSIRAQILDLIADLSRHHTLAYLFISHDLSVVRTITDRVLVMQDGEIVEQGRTAEVFANPQHPYTQSLIEAAPVLPTIQEASHVPA
ncbi:dipeptide ABC transporter ATP-binding protein [Shimia sp. NS0008-38b]|uniref:ABC transporter ATP-binding protein n=1 Tax=Shimia sp. NS0008-38b TaxID=3127653 RepID=UPI0031081EAE